MSILPTLRNMMGLALAFTVAGTAAHADEPGPGGTKVPRPVTGEQIYTAVCQACHMPDAKGATGAATIPALAKNPVLSSSEYLLMIITHGRGAMPSLSGTLDATQIAAVATHVRTHFGNAYRQPVTVAEVKAAMTPAQ